MLERVTESIRRTCFITVSEIVTILRRKQGEETTVFAAFVIRSSNSCWFLLNEVARSQVKVLALQAALPVAGAVKLGAGGTCRLPALLLR